MKKKSDEQDLFNEAMRGVKKMTYTKIAPSAARQKKPIILEKKTIKIPDLKISDTQRYDDVNAEDLLYFARDGLQHKVLRKLRKGQYNTEATLDLHGQTVSESKIALTRFLTHCQKQGFRHVLIIHGKGRSYSKPILKNKLNHWLREIDWVLAFCSATSRDGSTGALYVLLRRHL